MNSRVPQRSEERGERGASRATTTALPCGAARQSSYPVPALPSTCTIRARYLHLRTGIWYTADASGIRAGLTEAVIGDVQPLDFDTALDLSQRYLEEADLAEARGDAKAEEQWATWAEQLQIWAAQRVPAPGRLRTAAVGEDRSDGGQRPTHVIIRPVHADDQAVSFAALTRRAM